MTPETMPETKFCRGCDRELDITAFCRDRNRYDGHYCHCRECVSKKRRGLTLVPGLVPPPPRPICAKCEGPAPCDCWKTELTPTEREAAQLAVLARYVGVLDARKE
jgi:hypothetical protein